MKTMIVSGLISLALLTGCTSGKKNDENEKITQVPIKGELKISGADAMFPLLKVLAGDFMKLHPELNIEVEKGGTGKGLQKLLNNEVDLAMVSRELTSDEESLGLWFFPIAKEGIVAIVNAKNPYLDIILKKGIKRNTLKEIYRNENSITWGNILTTDSQEHVLSLTRADASGAAVVWAKYLGIPQDGLKGIAVEGDEGMIQKVMEEPFSLGYCNAHYAFDFKDQAVRDGIEIIPLDINNSGEIDVNEKFYENLCMTNRAAYLGKYPIHLCREIALVSPTKPTDHNIIEFLRWIYGDGQKVIIENGYSELRNCTADDYLNLLNQTIFK